MIATARGQSPDRQRRVSRIRRCRRSMAARRCAAWRTDGRCNGPGTVESMPANNESAMTPAALPAVPSAPVAPMPLSGVTLALGTIALSLATFMNVLDTSIANVSIPAIAGDLAVSPDQGTWVITSFGVANAISLPLTGWLTQRFGQVKLFTASVVLFVIASFLFALAPVLSRLVRFPVLSGAGVRPC